MNDYGQRAQGYWSRWLPERYRGIDDTEAFFTELGDQIEERVVATWDQLVINDTPPANERHAAREARLQALKRRAEETVLEDMAFLAPEPEAMAEPDLGLESDEAFQQRVDTLTQRQRWRSETCTALVERRMSVDELTDEQLREVIDYASPDFLLACGTSIDEQRAKGRRV